MSINLDAMKDVGTNLIVVVACHSPDYPIYIPFDIQGTEGIEEWVISWTEEPMVPEFDRGLYIKNIETSAIRMFEDVPTFLYQIQTEIADWNQLLDRSAIATRSIAALTGKRKETIEDVLGEGFVEKSIAAQKRLEVAMFEEADLMPTPEQMYKWLTKTTIESLDAQEEEVEARPSLTIVEDDDV